MKFTLTMELDNDAFLFDEGDVDGDALAKALAQVSEAVYGVTGGGDCAFIHDVNGNRCGKWEVN